jgi:hypothetical protein
MWDPNPDEGRDGKMGMCFGCVSDQIKMEKGLV